MAADDHGRSPQGAVVVSLPEAVTGRHTSAVITICDREWRRRIARGARPEPKPEWCLKSQYGHCFGTPWYRGKEEVARNPSGEGEGPPTIPGEPGLSRLLAVTARCWWHQSRWAAREMRKRGPCDCGGC